MLYYFSYRFRGIPCGYGIGWYVFGDYGTCPYDCVFSDGNAAENGRPGADRGALFYENRLDRPVGVRLEISIPGGCPGIQVVYESDVVAYKDVVLDCNAFAYEGVAGDFAVPSDFRVFLDLHETSDLTVVSYYATVKIDEGVDFDPFADYDVWGNSLRLTVIEVEFGLTDRRIAVQVHFVPANCVKIVGADGVFQKKTSNSHRAAMESGANDEQPHRSNVFEGFLRQSVIAPQLPFWRFRRLICVRGLQCLRNFRW